MAHQYAGFFDRLNLLVKATFNKGYKSLPEGLDVIMYKFNAGKKEVEFPISIFKHKVRKFKGKRGYRDPSQAFKFTVQYDEFEDNVVLRNTDYLDAAMVNDTDGLNLFVEEIKSLGRAVAEFPLEYAIDMIEQGTGTDYGVCFDTEPLFSATHAYDDKAGTQSNLLTGTGVTDATIAADVRSARTALRSFRMQSYNDKTGAAWNRPINGAVNPVILCPMELQDQFEKILMQDQVSDGTTTVSNDLKGKFKVIPLLFADAKDWYMVNNDSGLDRVIVANQLDKAIIKTPADNDPKLVEENLLAFRSNIFRVGFGYGAWYKIVKINNA